jgi:hypothetical protein
MLLEITSSIRGLLRGWRECATNHDPKSRFSEKYRKKEPENAQERYVIQRINRHTSRVKNINSHTKITFNIIGLTKHYKE